jgi:catechol 2,3-dioxygenase-like lactoylglutathione lyase family enzyme
MINGAHVIVHSRKPEADRAFFRDVLGLSHVDVGDGWLIFGLPPAEVAVHPGRKNGVHQLFLMCDDVKAFVRAMRAKRLVCGPVQQQGWGLLTTVTLPGGGTIAVYEPRHARPAAKPAQKPTPERGKKPPAKPRPAAKKSAVATRGR